jgi:hypothetical protein
VHVVSKYNLFQFYGTRSYRKSYVELLLKLGYTRSAQVGKRLTLKAAFRTRVLSFDTHKAAHKSDSRESSVSQSTKALTAIPRISYLVAAIFALALVLAVRLRLQPVVGGAVLRRRTTHVVLNVIASRGLDAGDVATADLDSLVLVVILVKVTALAGVESALDVLLADLNRHD